MLPFHNFFLNIYIVILAELTLKLTTLRIFSVLISDPHGGIHKNDCISPKFNRVRPQLIMINHNKGYQCLSKKVLDK
jgi:hypothetical protein